NVQKRPHPIRVGLEIRSLPSQAIKLLACEGRLCWYSNTLLGYCVKIGMLPRQQSTVNSYPSTVNRQQQYKKIPQ
ncbi:hypothetical protein, partial [Calothrix parietina]|uniref:hypothetical protein n=2 Tax=Calothrix TaxID=1186 RepID=UPI001A7EDCF5